MMDRVILHCDMNCFFASVELLDHPELTSMPVAVCGDPNGRHGIILAKNEIAKKAGVVTAETAWQARKKCPGLYLLRPHHDKYRKYSRMINDIYYRFTDMVEPFSIDESWLDVTASTSLFGSGREIADRIRNTVRSELGLTLSAGVSFNKVFAKMGSEYKKPDATTVIDRDNFRELLFPLPVSEMFFIGKATSEKLNSFGIMTIGDLADTDRGWLTKQFGKYGDTMYEYVNGLENSPVSLAYERHKIKSVGNGMTFERNLTSMKDIRAAVISLSDTVSGRLRKYEMKCCGVKVDIKDPSFRTISRQARLPYPANSTEDINRAAIDIISRAWKAADPIRLITITGIDLTDDSSDIQLSLFCDIDKNIKENESLGRTMDTIREKFGRSAITYGSIINNDIGIPVHDDSDNDEI